MFITTETIGCYYKRFTYRSDAAAMNDSSDDVNQEQSTFVSESAGTVDNQPLYASIRKFNQIQRLPMTTTDKQHVTVTSEGVVKPVRFAVRLVGSVPMSDDDLEASSKFVERHMRRLCRPSQRDNSTDQLSGVVYFWPTVSIRLKTSVLLYR